MKPTRFFLFCCLFAALVGCRNPHSPIDRDNLELALARARWQAHQLENYTIEQQRLCFCSTPHDFVKLTVENGQIVAGVEVESGEAVPADLLQYFETVDQVFDWIEQELARVPPVATLDVEYDQFYGYPTEIAYDYSEGIADDELWINMRALEDLAGD